jgi:hypothetical protein
MRSPAFRFATGLAVLLLVIAGVAAAVVGYKIASLKADLAQNLGRALGAKVDVTTLELDLQKGEIHAAGITLANLRPDAPWDRGEISQATLRFHLLDLFSSSLPLTVEVSSWSVVLHPHGQGQEAPAPSATPGSGGMEPGSRESPSKRGVHVTQLTARDGEVDFDLEAGRQIVIRGVSFNSSDNGAGVWTTQLQAGSVSAGTLQAGPGSVEIEADRDKATFSDFRLQCGSGGVTGDGDLALGAGQAAHMDLKLADVPVSMLVPIEWQMKLSGLANGSLRYATSRRRSSTPPRPISPGRTTRSISPISTCARTA